VLVLVASKSQKQAQISPYGKKIPYFAERCRNAYGIFFHRVNATSLSHFWW